MSGRGSTFETVIEASQSLVLLTKIPNGHKYLRGGEIKPIKGPVDYMGMVKTTVLCNPGRMLVFDAKECSNLYRYPCGDVSHLPRHQVEHIVRYGQAGAIAGVLIWARHKDVGKYFWLDWFWLRGVVPSSMEYGMMFEMRSERMAGDKYNVQWDALIHEYQGRMTVARLALTRQGSA